MMANENIKVVVKKNTKNIKIHETSADINKMKINTIKTKILDIIDGGTF